MFKYINLSACIGNSQVIFFHNRRHLVSSLSELQNVACFSFLFLQCEHIQVHKFLCYKYIKFCSYAGNCQGIFFRT